MSYFILKKGRWVCSFIANSQQWDIWLLKSLHHNVIHEKYLATGDESVKETSSSIEGWLLAAHIYDKCYFVVSNLEHDTASCCYTDYASAAYYSQA